MYVHYLIGYVVHICWNFQRRTQQHEPVIEQLGSYDPLVNEHNERLVALNFERIRHWIGNGADVTLPVLQLLGGFISFYVFIQI